MGRMQLPVSFAGQSMRIAVLMGVCLIAVGCMHRPAAAPPPVSAVKPVPVAPFDGTPQSFVVRGKRFIPGELAIVRVCIDDDHSITSADVIESSGDRQFDEVAVQWARQVRMRTTTQDDGPVDRCGAVRVEIRLAPNQRQMGGPDSSLS